MFYLFSGGAQADGWSYEFEPYLMISSINGDAGIGRIQGAPVDVDMDAILENLDSAFMGHFEAHHESGWGLALDYGYMDLRDDIAGPRGGIVGVRVRQGVLEALVTKRKETKQGQLEVFAGFRWWDNDFNLRIDPAVLPGTPSTGLNEDWIDLVIGARWKKDLNDRWKLQLRGDIGGLGLESDFTSSVSIGFRRTINERLDLDLQYKATWVDFEEGSAGQPGFFAYDALTNGPVVGLIIKF